MKTYVLIVLILALITLSRYLPKDEDNPEVPMKIAGIILIILLAIAIIFMSYMPE